MLSKCAARALGSRASAASARDRPAVREVLRVVTDGDLTKQIIGCA